MLFEAELDFLVPPKGNRYVRTRKGGFIPSRIKEKINDAVIILRSLYKDKPISVPVEVEVIFILPDRRKRDLDNMMKTLGDVLEESGIIENDWLIAKQTISRAFSRSRQEKTVIKIRRIDEKFTE